MNHIYIGGPPLDPPDEEPQIKCTYCGIIWFSSEWKRNHGHCPGCQREFAGVLSED